MHLVDLDALTTRFEGLDEQAKYATLQGAVRHLTAAVSASGDYLRSLRIWLVSSTERGGGVAEMLPRIAQLMRGFGVPVSWLIIDDADPVRQKRFFALTKYLHNSIHDAGAPLGEWWPEWVAEVAADADRAAGAARGDPNTPPQAPPAGEEPANLRAFRHLYEAVNAENADAFLDTFCTGVDVKRDLVIVHDPQPAGMIGRLRDRAPRLRCVWRCHIGLDVATPTTDAAWGFLRRYIERYDAGVFSASEYVPPWLRDAGRGFVVHPGISPLAPKNKELSPYEVTQVLMRAGLMHPQMVLILQSRGCELIDAPFTAQARIYEPRPGSARGGGAARGGVRGAASVDSSPSSPCSAGFHPAIERDVLNKFVAPSSPAATAGGSGSSDAQHQRGGSAAAVLAAAAAALGGGPDVTQAAMQRTPPRGQPQQHSLLGPSGAAERGGAGGHRPQPVVMPSPTVSSTASDSGSSVGSAGGAGGSGGPAGGERWSLASTDASLSIGPGGQGGRVTVGRGSGPGGACGDASGVRLLVPQPPLTPIYRTLGVSGGASEQQALSLCFSPEMLDKGIAFMSRPIVTQISRWDRLKGWLPLVRAWVDLKTHQEAYVAALDAPCAPHDVPSSCLAARDRDHHRRMLRNVRGRRGRRGREGRGRWRRWRVPPPSLPPFVIPLHPAAAGVPGAGGPGPARHRGRPRGAGGEGRGGRWRRSKWSGLWHARTRSNTPSTPRLVPLLSFSLRRCCRS